MGQIRMKRNGTQRNVMEQTKTYRNDLKQNGTKQMQGHTKRTRTKRKEARGMKPGATKQDRTE